VGSNQNGLLVRPPGWVHWYADKTLFKGSLGGGRKKSGTGAAEAPLPSKKMSSSCTYPKTAAQGRKGPGLGEKCLIRGDNTLQSFRDLKRGAGHKEATDAPRGGVFCRDPKGKARCPAGDFSPLGKTGGRKEKKPLRQRKTKQAEKKKISNQRPGSSTGGWLKKKRSRETRSDSPGNGRARVLLDGGRASRENAVFSGSANGDGEGRC